MSLCARPNAPSERERSAEREGTFSHLVRAVERAALDVEQQLLDLVRLRHADREVVLPVEREERLAVDAELLERRPEALVAHAPQPHADLVARPLRDVVGVPVVLSDDERLRQRGNVPRRDRERSPTLPMMSGCVNWTLWFIVLV